MKNETRIRKSKGQKIRPALDSETNRSKINKPRAIVPVKQDNLCAVIGPKSPQFGSLPLRNPAHSSEGSLEYAE